MDRRCPDCGVTMESVTLRTNGGYELQVVSDEKRGGILGSLGMNERFDLEAVPVRSVDCFERTSTRTSSYWATSPYVSLRYSSSQSTVSGS